MAALRAAPSLELQAAPFLERTCTLKESIADTRQCTLSDTECGSDHSVLHFGSEEEQCWPTHFVMSTESDEDDDSQSQFAMDSENSSEMDGDWDWCSVVEALELSDQYVFDPEAIAALLHEGATSTNLADHLREEMATHLEHQAMSFLDDAERPCTTRDLSGRMTPPLSKNDSTSTLEGPRWRVSELRSSLRKSLEHGRRQSGRRRSLTAVDCMRATRKSLASRSQETDVDIDSKMAVVQEALSNARRWRRHSIQSVLRSTVPEIETLHQTVVQSRIEEAVSLVKAGLGNCVANTDVAHSARELALRQIVLSQPCAMECTGRVWIVVGGRETNGIIVRRDRSLISSVLDERLVFGSQVEELRLIGNRLHYRRFRGDGPQTGWITVKLTGDRPLVVPLIESDE